MQRRLRCPAEKKSSAKKGGISFPVSNKSRQLPEGRQRAGPHPLIERGDSPQARSGAAAAVGRKWRGEQWRGCEKKIRWGRGGEAFRGSIAKSLAFLVITTAPVPSVPPWRLRGLPLPLPLPLPPVPLLERPLQNFHPAVTSRGRNTCTQTRTDTGPRSDPFFIRGPYASPGEGRGVEGVPLGGVSISWDPPRSRAGNQSPDALFITLASVSESWYCWEGAAARQGAVTFQR